MRSEGYTTWSVCLCVCVCVCVCVCYSTQFPTSQNFYEGDAQVWRPYSHFPRGLGTRLTKSRVCRSGTRANSMYMENFNLGRRLTFANLSFCGSSRNFSPRNLGAWHPWRGKSEHSARVFSAKIVFCFNWPSFLPPKFSLYGIASSSWPGGWLDQRKRSTLSAALV